MLELQERLIMEKEVAAAKAENNGSPVSHDEFLEHMSGSGGSNPVKGNKKKWQHPEVKILERLPDGLILSRKAE